MANSIKILYGRNIHWVMFFREYFPDVHIHNSKEHLYVFIWDEVVRTKWKTLLYLTSSRSPPQSSQWVGNARKLTLLWRWLSGSLQPSKLVLTSQLLHCNLRFGQSQQQVIFRATMLPTELRRNDKASLSSTCPTPCLSESLTSKFTFHPSSTWA